MAGYCCAPGNGPTNAVGYFGGHVWQEWNAAGTWCGYTTNSTNAVSTWVNWNQTVEPRAAPSYTAPDRARDDAPPRPPSPWEMVRAKAKALLLDFLDDAQRARFEADGAFDLLVDDRLYEIRPGSRVVRLDPQTRRPLSRFCIHAPHTYGLPMHDVALGQKLLLEANEPEFLRIAKETREAA